jgi:hypothetical protein
MSSDLQSVVAALRFNNCISRKDAQPSLEWPDLIHIAVVIATAVTYDYSE